MSDRPQTTDGHTLTCACGWSGTAEEAWTHSDRRLSTSDDPNRRQIDELLNSARSDLADFFAKIKTPEMAQKIAHRLGKPHGAFANFAVRWVDATSALELELLEQYG